MVAELHIFVRFKYFHLKDRCPSGSYPLKSLLVLPGHFVASRYLRGSACVLNPLIVLPDLIRDHYMATDSSKASWLCASNRHKPLLVSELTDIRPVSRELVYTDSPRAVCDAIDLETLTVTLHATTM